MLLFTYMSNEAQFNRNAKHISFLVFTESPDSTKHESAGGTVGNASRWRESSITIMVIRTSTMANHTPVAWLWHTAITNLGHVTVQISAQINSLTHSQAWQ